jgi:ABC-type lipoprotein release transport system permease subunit
VGGLAIGIVASFGLMRLIRGLLFRVQPLDVPTFVGVSAVLLLVSLLASSAPARRAANLDPMKTLRDQ